MKINKPLNAEDQEGINLLSNEEMTLQPIPVSIFLILSDNSENVQQTTENFITYQSLLSRYSFCFSPNVAVRISFR
jgi:hypothetical protein